MQKLGEKFVSKTTTQETSTKTPEQRKAELSTLLRSAPVKQTQPNKKSANIQPVSQQVKDLIAMFQGQDIKIGDTVIGTIDVSKAVMLPDYNLTIIYDTGKGHSTTGLMLDNMPLTFKFSLGLRNNA